MATKKVGVYRSYHGSKPRAPDGKLLPKAAWPDKRACSWVVRWFGEDRRRYSQSFPTRREAERFAESKQKEVRDGRSDRPSEIDVAQFIKEHMRLSNGTVRPTTLAVHVSTWKLLSGQVGWTEPISRISSKDIESFRARRLGGVSPSTVNKEIAALKRMFNLAIERRYLLPGSNPCIGIKRIKVAGIKPRFVSPEQFRRVYEESTELCFRAMLLVLYTTALRKHEASNVTWDDLDLDSGTLTVGRHQRAGYVQPWSPKGHELRRVPLPQEAADVLMRLKLLSPPLCPYVFMDAARWTQFKTAVDAGTWVSGRDLINNQLRRFQTACRRAGVPEFKLHDLRRTAITNWAKAGVPIHVAQQLAGHADLQTTQKFYLSVQDDDLAAARNAQQQLVAGLSGRATDQKMTNSAIFSSNLKRKEHPQTTQLPSQARVA